MNAQSRELLPYFLRREQRRLVEKIGFVGGKRVLTFSLRTRLKTRFFASSDGDVIVEGQREAQGIPLPPAEPS